MIAPLKDGIDLVVGSDIGGRQATQGSDQVSAGQEPDVVLDQFELDFDEPGCSTAYGDCDLRPASGWRSSTRAKVEEIGSRLLYAALEPEQIISRRAWMRGCRVAEEGPTDVRIPTIGYHNAGRRGGW